MFQLFAELHGHVQEVRGVDSFSTLEGGVCTCSLDGTAKIWAPITKDNITTVNFFQINQKYECIKTFVGHKNQVMNVRYNSFHKNLVTCSLEEVRNIIIWDIEKASIIDELKGHGPVSCLTITPNGDILTGSWDKTAKLWKNGWCVETFKGHTSSVLATLQTKDGTVITASSDSFIRIHYKDGKKKVLTGHRQPVRGLSEIPGLGFVSVSNDGYLITWSLDGEKLSRVKAHKNLIYCVKVLSTGEIITGSEDNTIKIWKNGNCIQTIRFPKSIWEVAELNNGDIAVATTDSVCRVFSKSEKRIGDKEVVQNFLSEIERYQREFEKNKVDVTTLPDLSVLKEEGKNGQTKMINNKGVGEVYQFEEGKGWVKMGYIVDQPVEEEEDGNMIDGVEYDVVLPVEISSNVKLKLGYNYGQDPYEVSREFIFKHELEDYFLEEIAQHLIQTVPFSLRNRGVEEFKDPYNEGRYTAKEASTEKEPNYSVDVLFPSYYVSFPDANIQGISKKVLEINKKLNTLNDIEVKVFQNLLDTLKDKKPLKDDHSKVLEKLLQWPKEDVFPIIDLIRLVPMKDKETIDKILAIGFQKDSSEVLQMLTFRFLCNLFGKYDSYLFDHFEKFISLISKGNTNYRNAYSSLLINYSAMFSKMNIDKTKLFDLIIHYLKEEKDTEPTQKLLIALGTLTHNNLQGKKKVLDQTNILFRISREVKDCKKVVDQLLAYEKEI